MHVVIIGAGIGGLTLANYLVKQGKQVTLFEAHHTPGGYTAGFRHKGFYFESGTLSFEMGRQVFKAMKEVGVYDKIHFTPQKSQFFAPRFQGAPNHYPQYKDMMLSAYPEEQKRLNRFFAETDRLVNVMASLQPPDSFFGALAMPARLVKFLLLMRKYNNTPLSEFVGRFFDRSSQLFSFFQDMGYPDMAAWILGGAFYTIFEDYYTVQNGMQSWADVLAEEFLKQGGKLALKSPVERILTKNGAAVGVTVGGENIAADVVVSAMDYKKTFLQLLDAPELIPAAQRQKISATSVSEGIFTVYLGLTIADTELRKIMHLPHVAFYDENFGADVRKTDDADHFNKATLSLYSPSLMSAELAPAGKSSLMISAVAPYHWMDNWGGGNRAAYTALKQRVTETIIRRIDRLIPGIDGHIEFKDAATPLTYERYTGNTDGATSAFSWNPKKRFYKSFISSHVKTPVKNLYIGSCWATQIGGVPGAIGAAQKIAKMLRKKT